MITSVIAACDIPRGICSSPGVGNINMLRLLEKSTPDTYYYVEVTEGYLTINEKQAGPNWATHISVARNCHEQNIELSRSPRGLILRTTRPIKYSDELYVWIGADLLLELDIPFLKPFNIKGNLDYHCHLCGHVFQNPNPLKVHLLFHCDPSKSSNSLDKSKKNNFHEKLKLSCSELSKSFGAITRVSILKEQTFPLVIYPRHPSSLNSDAHQLFMPEIQGDNATCYNSKLGGDVMRAYTSPNSYTASTSNIWSDNSSKQIAQSPGHVCPYCGKVYSRKYGLKIHVRTHTGYKPLKCKYCLRPFSDPSNLNKHVRLHSDSDTPYRCPICGKVLVRRRDLQRHIKSRHEADTLNDALEKIDKNGGK